MNRHRQQHWEDIYRSKSAKEVSWYQSRPDVSLRLIEQYAPDNLTAIIDVGGGASRLADLLYERGYRHLAVLDISATALDVSINRLGDNARDIEWYVDDVTSFKIPHPFGIWHDRAVFHFLTEADDRDKYIKILKKAVPTGGHVILGAFAIGGPTQCSGLDIVQYDAEKLCTEIRRGFKLVHEENEQHHTPGGKMQLFNWFVLQRE